MTGYQKKMKTTEKHDIMKNILFAATISLLIVSCHSNKKEEAPEIPEIYVANPVTDSVVLENTYPGYLKAANSAEVVARVSGQIISRNYKEGDFVNKGQVLFVIESTKYRDAVEQAQGAYSQAQSQHEYYSKQYAAMKKALAADAVSQMEVAQAESNMNSAAASMKTAAAQLQTARTNLGYCTITAPISGHISAPEIDPGNYVTGEGASVKLATIYDDSYMKAVFDIEDAQYELMVGKNGGTTGPLYRTIPLKFSQALPHNYTADLYYTSPSVDPTTGTLTLEGKVANPDRELKDGMYVTVSLPYGVNPKAVLVNDASIGNDQLGKYVYLVNDSNKVVYTPIETGAVYHDTLRIVNKGVKPTDRYVTKALLTVRNGEEVKPVMAAKPAKAAR